MSLCTSGHCCLVRCRCSWRSHISVTARLNGKSQDYEVGWRLKKAVWGKGYATEARRGAIEYGFNILQLPVIYTVVKPENHASMRVTQRLGMVPMGRTHKYYGVELELFKLDTDQFFLSCQI